MVSSLVGVQVCGSNSLSALAALHLCTSAHVPSRIGNDLVCQVIDDNRTLEIGNCRLCPVPLTNDVFPLLGIEPRSVFLRFPQVDSARRSAILGTEVVLTNEPGCFTVFRRTANEELLCLLTSDRLGKSELNQSGDHECLPLEHCR